MIKSIKFIISYSNFILSFTRKLVNIIYKFKFIMFGKPLNRFAKKKTIISKNKLYNRITNLLLFSNKIIKFLLPSNIYIVKRNKFSKSNTPYLSMLPLPLGLNPQLTQENLARNQLNLELNAQRDEARRLLERYEHYKGQAEDLMINERNHDTYLLNKYSFNMDPKKVIAKSTDNSLAFAQTESSKRNINDSVILEMIRDKAQPNIKSNESVVFEQKRDYILFVKHTRDDVAIDSIPEPLNNKIVDEMMPVLDRSYRTLREVDNILFNCALKEHNFNTTYNTIEPSPLMDILRTFQIYVADLETFAILS
jgi:hypothetical protein